MLRRITFVLLIIGSLPPLGARANDVAAPMAGARASGGPGAAALGFAVLLLGAALRRAHRTSIRSA